MRQPSRFEAALDLACAAMTVLCCGQFVDQHYVPEPREGVSLREEFSAWFSRHCHYNAFFKAICRSPKDEVESITNGRTALLLDIRVMPSVIGEAFKRECPDWTHGTWDRYIHAPLAGKISGDLGLSSQFVRRVVNDRVDYLRLDEMWHEIRAELYRRSEVEGLL